MEGRRDCRVCRRMVVKGKSVFGLDWGRDCGGREGSDVGIFVGRGGRREGRWLRKRKWMER